VDSQLYETTSQPYLIAKQNVGATLARGVEGSEKIPESPSVISQVKT